MKEPESALLNREGKRISIASPSILKGVRPRASKSKDKDAPQNSPSPVLPTTTVKSNKPSALIEHIASHYDNYLGIGNPDTSFESLRLDVLGTDALARQNLHYGVFVLFQELLHNSIDEYLEGHGTAIDVLCSSETITIRDYGRGIPHNRLKTSIQELSKDRKQNSGELRYCEGLSGLGLKLVNALSSRFLIRSYRERRFAEIESAEGIVQRERRGRCDKADGSFIRFTPNAEIFGNQAVRVPALFDILSKIAALYPGLNINLNQSHVIVHKGVGDLFSSLSQWQQYNYAYEARSLQGKYWQLSFSHLSDWQNHSGGLQNGLLVQSFVNGRSLRGGLLGGAHMLHLQGAFLEALRTVFPEKIEELAAFWDRGITLFFSLNLLAPHFRDVSKTQLLETQGEAQREIRGEIEEIAVECREEIIALLRRDDELREKLQNLVADCENFDEQGFYQNWQAKVAGGLALAEEQAQKIDTWADSSESKLEKLEKNLQDALEEGTEIQQHWRNESIKLTVELEQAEKDLSELKKEQRTENRNYRKELEKRSQDIHNEQEAYAQLKKQLLEQSEKQHLQEQQHQDLVEKGLEDWNKLQESLVQADNLQKQRDLEQKQILQYLGNAKTAAQTEAKTAVQGIRNAEQHMRQRQKAYLQNLEENANRKFLTINEEIDGRKLRLEKELTRLDKVWKERLEAGEEEAKAHFATQNKLIESRKELEQFLREQKGLQEGQTELCQRLLAKNKKDLLESQKDVDALLKAQKLERERQKDLWQKQLTEMDKELQGIRSEAKGQVEARVEEWLKDFEALTRDNTSDYVAKQKAIKGKQRAVLNDLAEIREEKDKQWGDWQREFGDSKESLAKHLLRNKAEWEERQRELARDYEKHLQRLKKQQFSHQQRIEEAQSEQIRALKQVQQFQRDADGRMSTLNKNLASYTDELRKEIQSSVEELRENTDHQLSAAEQEAQNQTKLYQQKIWQQEQENLKQLDSHKDALSSSLDAFRDRLEEEQKNSLVQELGEWSTKFLDEQSLKEKEAAKEAQRQRSEFWREQQQVVQEEIQQQRSEFQDLHKSLQATMDRDRDRLYNELTYLQQLAKQQEESVESLSQSLTRDVEQRSSRLKQEMETNYRQFYEEILKNTRELHQINSDERRSVSENLANMQRDIEELNRSMDLSQQNLLNLQKGLPDSLKLERSLDGLAQKSHVLEEVEAQVAHVQNVLQENSEIGQKTSEQLASLLARRSELSEIEQEMQNVTVLSEHLTKQNDELLQQQERVSDYKEHLSKLERLYKENSKLLEFFDEHRDQIMETTTLLSGYSSTMGNLERSISAMQEQLEPLELGFGKAQELQEELLLQQQQLQDTKQEMAEMQGLMTELHDDSQGIDKMREWIAKTETRMMELSQDIQNNLRTVETIVRNNGPEHNSSKGKVNSEIRDMVVQLNNKKWSSREIARTTHLSVGEVELILEMLPNAS